MLHPDAYFAKYWQRRAKGIDPYKAFMLTEREMFRVYGVRRFRNYGSFKNALSQHHNGKYSKSRIVLYIMEHFDIKEND